MGRTTLTAALKPLQRRGLVEVKPGSRDKRSRLLTLTPAGVALLAAAMPVWEGRHPEAHVPGLTTSSRRRTRRRPEGMPPPRLGQNLMDIPKLNDRPSARMGVRLGEADL